MTLRTVTGYTGMVKHCISKADGVMAIGAVLAIGTGRYVITEFTYTDPVVVACIAAISDTGMIISPGAEGTGSMAVAAILVTGGTRIVRIGWHVRIERCGNWLACGCNQWRYRIVIAMARLAIVHDARVIDTECRNETLGVMARSTIGAGDRMCGHCG